MFNGVTQSVLSGVVPGNRNIDNTAPELQNYHHIIYPNRSLDIASKEGGMKAGLLKSFGFGQAGAEILVVHPDYLLATLDNDTYARYTRLRNAREAKAYRYQQGVISGKHTLIQVKDAPPYTEEQQPQVRDSILRETKQLKDACLFPFFERNHLVSRKKKRNHMPRQACRKHTTNEMVSGNN